MIPFMEVTVDNFATAQFIYGYDNTGKKLGKLNLSVYENKFNEVVVVPVNGATVPAESALENEINTIFKQASASFDITIAPNFEVNYDLNNNGLDGASDSTLSLYSEEMKAIRRVYFDSTAKENKLYLFVVPEIAGDLKGYMVRGKIIGFIENGQPARTYAHELGHGAYGLEHTFPEVPLRGSDNVLDYAGGTHLTHEQWYTVQHFTPTWSFLDNAEDGEYSMAGLSSLSELINTDNSSFTFYNPNGYFVSLPSTFQKVYISTFEKFESGNPLPIGTLIAFKDDKGNLFTAKRLSTGNSFYQCDATQEIYNDSITSSLKPTQGIIGLTYVDNSASLENMGSIAARITSSYFKTNSPIGQTTYSIQNETKNENYFLFNENFITSSEYKDMTPRSLITRLKVSNEVLISEQFSFVKNNQISLNAFTYFGGGRNPIDFLRQEFDENTKVRDYAIFYDFINTPLVELFAQIRCLDEIIDEETGAYNVLVMQQMFYEEGDFHDPINEIKNVHQSIEEAIERYDDINLLAKNVPTTGLQLLLDHAESLGYHCFFNALDFDNRVIVLNAVIKDDEYWSYDDLNILNELFINASESEKIELIKMLKTKDWLTEIDNQLFEWDDIRDDLDFYAIQEFFSSITGTFISNYESFTVTHASKTLTVQGSSESIILNNIPQSALHSNAPFSLNLPATYTIQSNYNEYPIFIGEHEGLYNIYDARNTMPDAFKESIFATINSDNDEVPYDYVGGNFQVNCRYNLSSYDENVMPLDHQKESTDPNNIFLYMNEQYNIDPFEFVELHFTSTYGSQNLELGTSVVVPAFQMMLYEKAVTLHKVQWIGRLVADVAEVTLGALAYLAAPATFGGSVAAFTAIVAAIDIAVTYDRNNPNYTLDQYNDPFYNTWNAFKTATDIGALGVGGFQALNAIGGLIKNRKAIAMACMLNYNIRRTKSLVSGTASMNNSRHLIYMESLRLGRGLDEIEDAFVFPAGFSESIDIASLFPTFAAKIDDWAHLGLTYEHVDDIIRIRGPSGEEIARIVKNGSTEIMEISDDYFRATGNNTTPITGISVKTSCGEDILGGGFVINGDGSIGFVEDVSTYGSQIVQNTIKHRGDLRNTIPGIHAGQEAHHYIPIQLLKENQVVQKAVEGGFDFNNGAVNGIALDKYSATTGLGRHGPHPNYTNQIRDYLDNVWAPANPNYTAQMARQELEDLILDLESIITNTSGRINLLDLGL
ncbi:MAG: AHH domain-containing protein [Crocinitomicaceae bacterium]